MQMLNFQRLLPVVSVSNNMLRRGNTAPSFCLVIEKKETCPVSRWSFNLHNMRRNFLDNLIPVHSVAPYEKPNARYMDAPGGARGGEGMANLGRTARLYPACV